MREIISLHHYPLSWSQRCKLSGTIDVVLDPDCEETACEYIVQRTVPLDGEILS